MLVDYYSLDVVLKHLAATPVLALDTETTGLRAYHGDKLFCIVIATDTKEYYFNFHPEHPQCLGKMHFAAMQGALFSDAAKTWVLQNAKFDLAILAASSGEIAGAIHDTMAVARVTRNDRLALGLDSLASDIGRAKIDQVKEHIKKEKLWEWQKVPGKDKREKIMFFGKVPFEIMLPYAEMDVRLTYDIYLHQLKELQELYDEHRALEWPNPICVYNNEMELTPALFRMEREGVMIDRKFCEAAAAYETGRMRGLEERFFNETGLRFKNSGKVFEKVFEGENFIYGKPTKKTFQINPVFDSDVLRTFKNPMALLVCEWRDAKSKADYYNGFLWNADKNSIIHCNFRQAGTVTGRMASAEPNLQNLSRPDEGDVRDHAAFTIRRAIIPRAPGRFFAMLDFEQMEYKLLLDIIGVKDLIEKVAGGYDVHQATADLTGLSRSSAKTVNFGLIYGQGVTLLAKNLGVSKSSAEDIKSRVLSAIPELDAFISQVQHKAEKRGFVFNWMGRRCYFKDPRFSYKAVNHLIQGGCADINKLALVKVDNFLRGFDMKIVLNVHDEIVLEGTMKEAHLLPEVKIIMESVYTPKNGLGMSVGVDHSFKSLADKIEGFPS